MLNQIHPWCFPNKTTIPDGYHERQIPQPTYENLEFLVEEHNKLVFILNKLILSQPEEIKKKLLDIIDEED